MLHVTCALIERDGLLLAAQRRPDQANANQWEFPGGKVEPGESHAQCLHREICEELGGTIEILASLPPLDHHYAARNLSLQLWPFRCRWLRGEPQLLDHQALRWLPPARLFELDWSEADRRLVAREFG